jgi:hypothetical protein
VVPITDANAAETRERRIARTVAVRDKRSMKDPGQGRAILLRASESTVLQGGSRISHWNGPSAEIVRRWSESVRSKTRAP